MFIKCHMENLRPLSHCLNPFMSLHLPSLCPPLPLPLTSLTHSLSFTVSSPPCSSLTRLLLLHPLIYLPSSSSLSSSHLPFLLLFSAVPPSFLCVFFFSLAASFSIRCRVLLSAATRMQFSVQLSLCLLGFVLVSLFPQPARGQGKYLH